MTVITPSEKAIEIKNYLIQNFPGIKELFLKSETLEYREASRLSTPSAMLRIVIGQMLSAKAADTIYGRVKKLADTKKEDDWKLSFEEYRSCGLSRTKANAVVNFGNYYTENKKEVENWKNLDSEKLITEIVKHKGIGRWTATIMALFHFGHDDIFPELDGALQRVLEILKTDYNLNIAPQNASPYRSYLAYYFWHFLDEKIL